MYGIICAIVQKHPFRDAASVDRTSERIKNRVGVRVMVKKLTTNNTAGTLVLSAHNPRPENPSFIVYRPKVENVVVGSPYFICANRTIVERYVRFALIGKGFFAFPRKNLSGIGNTVSKALKRCHAGKLPLWKIKLCQTVAACNGRPAATATVAFLLHPVGKECKIMFPKTIL